MTDWDPDLYRRFEDERTRPARDLLARIGVDKPHEIVDLGCGPGNSTECLAARYPDAHLSGIDRSAAMLVQARARLPGVSFKEAEIAGWIPRAPVDLLFANAVLQWLPDHAALLPRLLGLLAPGGVLAVQMPDNLDEPSHRAMGEIAFIEMWRDRLAEAGSSRAGAMLSARGYYDVLAPRASVMDVWRTVYHHPMPSARAIVDWFRSTGLRPYLDPLGEEEQAEFLRLYEQAIERAYPARTDGRRLLAFPRLFIIARRTPS